MDENMPLCSAYDDTSSLTHSHYPGLFPSNQTGLISSAEQNPLLTAHPFLLDDSRKLQSSDGFLPDRKQSYFTTLHSAEDDLYSSQSSDLRNLTCVDSRSQGPHNASDTALIYTDSRDRNLYNENSALTADMDSGDRFETSVSRQSCSTSSCTNSTDESGVENDVPDPGIVQRKSSSPTNFVHSELFSTVPPQLFGLCTHMAPQPHNSIFIDERNSNNASPDDSVLSARRHKQVFEQVDQEVDKVGDWNTGIRPVYSSYDFRSFMGDAGINAHNHIPSHDPPYTSVIVEAHQLQTYHPLTNGFAH